MTSTDKDKPADDRELPSDEQPQQETRNDEEVPKQRPADPDLADIEDLREVEKRSG